MPKGQKKPCPKCGTGKNVMTRIDGKPTTVTCDRCGGDGWV